MNKDEIETLAKIIPAEVLERTYEDGLAKPVSEAGSITTDILKTLHLFLAPFQLAAAYQDRLTNYLEQVRNAVPCERQTESPACIAGPVLMNLRFIEENNPLKVMYLNLLTRSIDKERQNEAHPAFANIIEQLSRDEAIILLYIRDSALTFISTEEFVLKFEFKSQSENEFNKSNVEAFLKSFGKHLETNLPRYEFIEGYSIPVDKLASPQLFSVYISHLVQLNLIETIKDNSTLAKSALKETTSAENDYLVTNYYSVKATPFGQLFIKACLPGKF